MSIVSVAVLLIGSLSAAPASAVGFPTVTTLDASPNPSPACGLVTITATVHGAIFPDSPNGLVQFFDGASLLGGLQLITPDFTYVLGVKVGPTDHSSAFIQVPLSGGTHVITAGYAGTDVPSLSSPLIQNVTAATSTTAVTSAVNPTVFGQQSIFSADVSSSCSGSVAGIVQFQVDGADVGTGQILTSGGHASLPVSSLQVGTHPVTAVFTSSSTDVQASKGTLTGGQTVTPADTTTAVSSSANPSEFGASVAFTAATTATPPGAGTATGSTQFADNSTALGAPQNLDTSGRTTLPTAALTVGSHAITGGYTSNTANFGNSTGTMTQVVNPARTTLTYDGATSADYNDPAALAATLTRTDNAAPVAGQPVTLTMGAQTCGATTDAGGHATCNITPTEAAGPAPVTAVFAGDGNYLPAAASAPFLVLREETRTTYTGPGVIAQNSPVTLSGRLLEDGTTPIAGRALTLTLGTGPSSQACTTTPTGTGGNGQCTLPGVTVGQGPQPVRADFAGDAYYLPSTDASHQVVIFAFPTRGIFLLGDQGAPSAGTTLTYWSAQWSALNALSSGAAPDAFKGFAGTTSSTPPSCAGSWNTGPGNSSHPVGSVPSYMGTAVTTSVAKSGGTLSGPITHIVVIATAPGYSPNPGHPGTGTIVATYC